VSITSSAGVNGTYIWRIRLGGTVSNGTLSFSAITNTNYEFAIGDESITHDGNGFVVGSGTGVSRTQEDVSNSVFGLRPGNTIDGVIDVLYLTYTPLQSNQDMSASLKLVEL